MAEKATKKAVILSGGKQYLVEEGQELEIELLAPANLPAGRQGNATFEPLLVVDGERTLIGTPKVEGIKVAAEIKEQVVKADKVTAIRFKAKKRVHKTHGHRQKLTRIRVTKIQ